MEEKEYSLTDLLLNESFIQWVHQDNSEAWEHWENPGVEGLKQIEKAKSIILAQQFKETSISDEEVDQIKLAIEKNIALREKSRRPLQLINLNTWMGRAAMITLLIATISLFYYTLSNDSQEPLLSESTGPTFIEKKAANGQKLSINLGDGTIVKLNSGSKLIFPKVFETDKREVFLEGEAFLKVERDENRPFILTSGNIKTTVLGTAFNVKAYKIDKTVEVALLSGKVSLQPTNAANNAEPVILKPNEMLIYDKAHKRSEKTNFDPTKVLAWKNKILLFENADFEEVIEGIERWYGVTFINSYKGTIEKEYSGVYENKSLKAVMEGVSFAYGFKFEIKDKVVIIK